MNDDQRYRVDPELMDEHDVDVDVDLEDEVEADDDGGAFHDPVLRRALAHAPDHAVLPMDETRESILSFAHEAVVPSLAAAPVWSQRSFVQRLLGMRGGAGFGAHIPWNGLVVIALVAGAVFVQERELMGAFRTKVAGSDADAQAQASMQTQATPPDAPSSAAVALSAALPAPVASAASVPTQPAAATAPVAAASVASAASAVPAAPTAPAALAAPVIATPSVESPADADAAAAAAARLALEQRLQRFEAAEAKARLAQRSDTGGLPPGVFSNALPRTAIPVEVPLASRAGRAGSAQPDVVASPSQTPSRVDESVPPTFTALSQWTRLTITSADGETRRIARADARELGPLVGSTALAGVGPQPLSGRIEWRIAFERNGEQLGLLEVAGSQIRWKEKGIPAGTGAPPASGLASLRQALKEAEAEQVKAAGPAPVAPAAPVLPAAPPSTEPAQ